MTPLILFLLGCATVFLGSIQAAFSALMRLSLRLMAERGGRDDRLGQYLDDPLHLFIPVRVLIGVSTVLAGVLIARLSDVRDALSVVTFIVSLVAFVVVCEHLLPMLIVRRDPERVLDVMLPAFHAVATVLSPITTVLLDLIDMRREREAPGNGHAADDAAPSAAGEKKEAAEGAISEEEGRELLQSIVDFTGTVVREVMTPRPDIIAIRVDATLQDLRTLFREEQYSRIPVYRDSLDNIVGIVFVKDLVALPHGAEPPMTTLMRTAHFVPESKRVSELLKEMQRRQTQMAIVVDEYGGTAGLVTLEDLLEELVGEIADEYDEPERLIQRVDATTYRVAGKLPIEQLNAATGLKISNESYDTVGGWVLDLFGRVPRRAERTETAELQLTVEKVERTRIVEVLVALKKPAKEVAA